MRAVTADAKAAQAKLLDEMDRSLGCIRATLPENARETMPHSWAAGQIDPLPVVPAEGDAEVIALFPRPGEDTVH